MSNTEPTPLSYTVADAARDLLRLELASPSVLLTAVWRSPSDVLRMLLGRDRHPELRHIETVDSALDYLAEQGLAVRAREEWEVSPSRPQRYRWSRLATPETLKRWSEPAGRCERPGCGRKAAGGKSRFCCQRCRERAARLGQVTRRRR